MPRVARRAVTWTLATGGMTVTTTWSNFWSIVARTMASPGLTAVTTPELGSTVAMCACDDVQATRRLGTTAPAASRGVAESVTVAPTDSDGSSGAIETLLVVGGGGAVGLSPPHAANVIANAKQADLRTDTLLRETTNNVFRGQKEYRGLAVGAGRPGATPCTFGDGANEG
jgi:hypothetical protein